MRMIHSIRNRLLAAATGSPALEQREMLISSAEDMTADDVTAEDDQVLEDDLQEEEDQAAVDVAESESLLEEDTVEQDQADDAATAVFPAEPIGDDGDQPDQATDQVAPVDTLPTSEVRLSDTQTGTDGNDVLIGTAERDQISTGLGNDFVFTFESDDRVVVSGADQGTRQGRKIIDTGDGSDVVELIGSPADYSIDNIGLWYRYTGQDGSSVVMRNVERIFFSGSFELLDIGESSVDQDDSSDQPSDVSDTRWRWRRARPRYSAS